MAFTGQAVPGTPSGVSYASFGSFHHRQPQFSFQYCGPVLNDAGQTAFRANLTGNGVDSTNNQGIWSEGSGSLTLVARTGTQPPAHPAGVNFAIDPGLELYSPVLSDAGQTAFYGALNDGRVGLWSEGTGSLALVAADGQQAAGVGVGVVHSFANLDIFLETPVLNDAGQTAFRSYLTGGGVNDTNNVGLWSGSSGNTALVARLGSQAPGTPSGVTFGSPQPPVFFYTARFLPVLNNVGQAAIYSQLTGSGVGSSNDAGIWSGDAGNVALVARTGSQAPGLPSGVGFSDVFLTTAINSAGHLAFVAGLTGENSTLHQDGIWSDRSGSLELVARRGNQAPGTPDGVKFDVLRMEKLNDAGQIAFNALLTGIGLDSTNDRGIWLEDSGNMTLVARAGNQAPGTPDGVNYSQFSPFQVGALTLTAAGQIVFGAALTGDGVDSTNDRGIWATDLTGATQLIVRTGEQLEVAPGDVRTVSDLNFVGGTSNNNGWPSGFNNLGQLAFWASFTDGSQGVFVSNAVSYTPGDFNRDGSVTGDDIHAMLVALTDLHAYETATGLSEQALTQLGDLNGDHAVTNADVQGLLNILRDVGESPAVPEPASVLQLACGILCLKLTVRRRSKPTESCSIRVTSPVVAGSTTESTTTRGKSYVF